MNKKIRFLILLITQLLYTQLLFTQLLKHPWHVIDRGGGKSTSGEVVLRSSFGQPLIQKMISFESDTNLRSGFVPALSQLSGIYTCITSEISEGWNLLAIPLNVDDYWTTAYAPWSSAFTFRYTDKYEIADTLKNGEGYWIKSAVDCPFYVMGTSYFTDTINVHSKWNMIGSVSYPILTSEIIPISPVTIQSAFYAFIPGRGYIDSDTLLPGYGYWVKVNGDGKLILNSRSLVSSSMNIVANKALQRSASSSLEKIASSSGLNKLSVIDAKGTEKTIYYSTSGINVDLAKYELPPLPPDGIFDLRFSNNKSVAIAEQSLQTYSVKIYSAEYPVHIKWEGCVKSGSALIKIDKKDIDLSQPGDILVNDPEAKIKLVLSLADSKPIPLEFALQQNYPNPFNPKSVINYQLSVDSWVSLKIFNSLGQEIATLVDEMQDAGHKSVEWNASEQPSGVYIYRLTAGRFTDLKKLVLVK